MARLEFTALIQLRGINPYVLISKEQAAQLQPNWRKPMPVLVQVNGQPTEPWHINMMPVGNGEFYLYLHENVRKASNTKVGDKVTVALKFDATYKNGPLHPMPSWLQEKLAANDIAQRNWDNLSPSRQKEILRNFASLKSEDARMRNMERALQVLSGTEARFMGRAWHDGS